MRTTIISRHIGWEENNTICLTHFEFYMDSDDDLPTSVYLPTDTPGVQYKIAQGSLAYDLSTSKLYVVNSEGTWVEQAGGGGSSSYTKAEIDAMLNGLSFLKCTQDEYDAMTAHDENTVYIIVG